jgi:hypothetical protein
MLWFTVINNKSKTILINWHFIEICVSRYNHNDVEGDAHFMFWPMNSAKLAVMSQGFVCSDGGVSAKNR